MATAPPLLTDEPSTASSESTPTPAVENPPSTSTATETTAPGAPSEATLTKRKITRSRIGCFTCRRRKKACDLGKPVCQGCTRLGLECEWPTNYQDTLPKKRAAEALAAAARATGRSETLGSTSRSRSASRARDMKMEKNGVSPPDGNAPANGNTNPQAMPGDHCYSPPSRRSSFVGSAYEDDSWMFPERMSYIHGDPSDMFDIYDDALAAPPVAQHHPVPNYANQTMQAQEFNPQLQHRSSAPAFMQLYSHGQAHPSIPPHQTSSDHYHLPPNVASNPNIASSVMYPEAVGHASTSNNSGSTSGLSGSGLAKSRQHDNHPGPPLNTTGLALTLDPASMNRHHFANGHPNNNQSGIGNFEWNHQATASFAGQVNLDDPLMQLLADGSYHPLGASGTPSIPTNHQAQQSHAQPHESAEDSHRQIHDAHIPASTSSAQNPEANSSSPLEKSLWTGLDQDQLRLGALVLEYYTQSLSKLVSCEHGDNDDPSRGRGTESSSRPNSRGAAGFEAFRSLAATSATSSLAQVTGNVGITSTMNQHRSPSTMSSPSSAWGPAQILHTALLAWASRHWLNTGEARYEAASEVWGKRAETMLARLFDESGEELFRKRHNSGVRAEQSSRQREAKGSDQDQGQLGDSRPSAPRDADGRTTESLRKEGDHDHDAATLTTLAACLMIIQWKSCRGDICDFQPIMRKLKPLSDLVFVGNHGRALPGSMEFHFMENLLYKDVLSTSIYVNAPILNPDALTGYSHLYPTMVHTLTGLALPIFIIMYRIAGLIRKKRERANLSLREGTAWRYDELVDLVSEAEKIQQDLDHEKRLIDEIIEKNPRLEPHRCLHEAFRLACVLQLRCQVLNEPSTSLPIRLLIRQLLGLLESMEKQSLPGWCSCHWVQFQTALYCLDIKCDNEQSDRDRINRLYDRTFHDLAFLNVPRSHKVVREVWRRSDAEGRHVDWLDVVQEWDWDLYLV